MAGKGRARAPDLRGFGLSDEDLRSLGYAVGPGGSEPSARRPAAGGPEREAPRPSRGPVDPSTRAWLVTLLALVAVAWLAHPSRYLPDPVPAGAPDTAFSSSRAMAQLVEIARAPRPSGSPEHERVRTQVLSRLTSLGLEAEVQTVTRAGSVGADGLVTVATVRNVVARIPGSAAEGTVVLSAPYDGPPLSPAAARGVGAAVTLEVVRALAAGPPPRNDIVVVFTDADELGGLGSRAFLEGHRWARDVRAVVSAGALGGTGPALPLGDGVTVPAIADALVAGHVRPGPSSGAWALAAVGDSVPGLLRPAEGDAPWIGFVAVGNPSTAGQPFDTSDRVSEATLQHAGTQMLSTVRALADESEAGARKARRASAWVPVLGSVPLPLGLAWPVTAAAFLLLGLLVALARWRGAGWRGLGVGAAVGVAIVGLSAWLAGALRDLLVASHPEAGFVAGAFYHDAPHVLAAVAIAVGVVTTAQALARRWLSSAELCVGALAVPVALSPWVTLRAPAGSLALHLPLAFAMLAAAVVVAAGPSRRDRRLTWLSVLVLESVTLFLLVPGVAAAGALWTFARAARVGALSGVAALLLVPVSGWLTRPRTWWTPVLAFGAAACAVGLALPAVRSGSAHPVPTTLVYLTDEPVPSPLTVMLRDGARVDSGGARRMAGRWLTVPGPGEAWARSWAVEPPEPGAEPGLLLLPREAEHVLIGGGPVATLVAPSAEVVERTEEGGRRLVRFRVRSGLGGEMLGIQIATAGGAIVGIEDAELGRGSPARTLVHWGRVPAEGLHFTAIVGADLDELEVIVVEHHLRPQDLLPGADFERADSLIPNVATGSDRLVQRTVLRLALEEPEALPPTGP